jgi:hypothetical protein
MCVCVCVRACVRGIQNDAILYVCETGCNTGECI